MKVGDKVVYFYRRSWGCGFATKVSDIPSVTVDKKYLVWIDTLNGDLSAKFGLYNNKEYEKVLPYNQLFAILKGIE